jgi:hypothetical protein
MLVFRGQPSIFGAARSGGRGFRENAPSGVIACSTDVRRPRRDQTIFAKLTPAWHKSNRDMYLGTLDS